MLRRWMRRTTRRCSRASTDSSCSCPSPPHSALLKYPQSPPPVFRTLKVSPHDFPPFAPSKNVPSEFSLGHHTGPFPDISFRTVWRPSRHSSSISAPDLPAPLLPPRPRPLPKGRPGRPGRPGRWRMGRCCSTSRVFRTATAAPRPSTSPRRASRRSRTTASEVGARGLPGGAGGANGESLHLSRAALEAPVVLAIGACVIWCLRLCFCFGSELDPLYWSHRLVLLCAPGEERKGQYIQ